MIANGITAPSRRQRIILRLMIVIGLLCMSFFLESLLRTSVLGYRPLYWLLLFTFVFTFFKIAYEWYHYWSISIPETPPVTRTYTVDVFTTFCAGEPYEMIEETLRAMQAISYPHESFLCDEADDPYLKSLCQSLGVHHITRTEKKDAKAGNINNALRQSSGELCVILDPDHIPVPGFLDPIVAHFDDPEIGFVQIVQAYYNQHTSWIAKGAAQQTYQFYGPMMMCMNAYGTVQAIGANCTFRRAALDSIGGHAAGLAEDMHTAMQLHAKKWKSLYLPRVLTRGLVPATLSAYYKQQLKWSRGVFELFVTTYPRLFTSFSWRQKLHYGLLPFFYFSGFVYLINFLIPVIALVTEVFPLRMDFSEFLIISIPFISAVILIRHYVQQWVMEDKERGFHIIGGLLMIGTWWIYILGVVYTLIRKDVPYVATPKEIKDQKNLRLNLPNIAVLLISVLAILYGLYADWNPFSLFMAGIVGLNCFFMIAMLIASSELKMHGYISSKQHISSFNLRIRHLKGLFWLFRRRIYSGMRRLALMLSILIVCISIYASKYSGEEDAPVELSSAGEVRALPRATVKLPEGGSHVAELPELLPSDFSGIRGVIYSKATSWYKNVFPLTKKTIVRDLAEMKARGVNSLKIYGPNIYDRSIIDIAEKNGIGIYYSFWIPDASYFMADMDRLEVLSEDILERIAELKSNPNIKSWNLGNTTFQQFSQYRLQAAYAGQAAQYRRWLQQLVAQIKSADKSRKLTLDVRVSAGLKENLNSLRRQVPGVDAFGLLLTDEAAIREISQDLDAPYFIGNIDPRLLDVFPAGGVFYANWQDQQSANSVTFDGLKDFLGHNKPTLYQISSAWQGKQATNLLPAVKILKAAITTLPGNVLSYRALLYQHEQWKFAEASASGMQYAWYLVKTDQWGNAIAINAIGKGPVVQLSIPENGARYRIYLLATEGNSSTDDYTTLNTPLRN